MRCVSFVLFILAVAVTSSARGQQPEAREALRDAVRDGDIGDRQSVREERREGRQERRDDRQEARSDRGGDHELLRLALLAALRDGDFGDRQSVREERREGRQERRDDRQEARGDRGGDHELLRLAFLRRFATGILEIGSRSERNVARVARNVGMTDKRRRRSGRRPRVVTPCASCGASRRGLWRSAVGQRGTSRGAPGTSG